MQTLNQMNGKGELRLKEWLNKEHDAQKSHMIRTHNED